MYIYTHVYVYVYVYVYFFHAGIQICRACLGSRTVGANIVTQYQQDADEGCGGLPLDVIEWDAIVFEDSDVLDVFGVARSRVKRANPVGGGPPPPGVVTPDIDMSALPLTVGIRLQLHKKHDTGTYQWQVWYPGAHPASATFSWGGPKSSCPDEQDAKKQCAQWC